MQPSIQREFDALRSQIDNLRSQVVALQAQVATLQSKAADLNPVFDTVTIRSTAGTSQSSKINTHVGTPDGVVGGHRGDICYDTDNYIWFASNDDFDWFEI